jgi:hypothetical protein
MQTMGGYVMGDVDGEMEGDVDGYVMGDDVVGRGHRGHMVRLPAAPAWRKRSAAPGVPMPGQGLEPLPLRAQTSGGTWTATNPTERIVYTGRSQRPFRAERLLVGVGRFQDTTAGVPQNRIVTDTLFFGTNLGQLQRGDIDIELLGAPTAFGVRMQQVDVMPGVDIEMPISLLGTALTGTQSIVVTVIWLGRSIQ